MNVTQINSIKSITSSNYNKNNKSYSHSNSNNFTSSPLLNLSQCASIIPFKGNPLNAEQKLSRCLKILLKNTGEITPEMINDKIAKLLIKVAEDTSEKSYAPYSKFHVGAAVISKDGKVYKGCNVENASYGVTLCAERNALSNMIAQDGYKQISALACAAKEAKGNEVWPCGACRQWIEEFDKDETAKIIANNHGIPTIANTKELLPRAFGPKDLGL